MTDLVTHYDPQDAESMTISRGVCGATWRSAADKFSWHKSSVTCALCLAWINRSNDLAVSQTVVVRRERTFLDEVTVDLADMADTVGTVRAARLAQLSGTDTSNPAWSKPRLLTSVVSVFAVVPGDPLMPYAAPGARVAQHKKIFSGAAAGYSEEARAHVGRRMEPESAAAPVEPRPASPNIMTLAGRMQEERDQARDKATAILRDQFACAYVAGRIDGAESYRDLASDGFDFARIALQERAMRNPDGSRPEPDRVYRTVHDSAGYPHKTTD